MLSIIQGATPVAEKAIVRAPHNIHITGANGYALAEYRNSFIDQREDTALNNFLAVVVVTLGNTQLLSTLTQQLQGFLRADRGRFEIK